MNTHNTNTNTNNNNDNNYNHRNNTNRNASFASFPKVRAFRHTHAASLDCMAVLAELDRRTWVVDPDPPTMAVLSRHILLQGPVGAIVPVASVGRSIRSSSISSRSSRISSIGVVVGGGVVLRVVVTVVGGAAAIKVAVAAVAPVAVVVVVMFLTSFLSENCLSDFCSFPPFFHSFLVSVFSRCVSLLSLFFHFYSTVSLCVDSCCFFFLYFSGKRVVGSQSSVHWFLLFFFHCALKSLLFFTVCCSIRWWLRLMPSPRVRSHSSPLWDPRTGSGKQCGKITLPMRCFGTTHTSWSRLQLQPFRYSIRFFVAWRHNHYVACVCHSLLIFDSSDNSNSQYSAVFSGSFWKFLGALGITDPGPHINRRKPQTPKSRSSILDQIKDT